MMMGILVLGAEVQAATSIARAYPERSFTFASDHPILDGEDLPNVRMVLIKLEERQELISDSGEVVTLCPRWLAPEAILSLSQVFEELELHFPGRMLPILNRPALDGRWIAKGDRRHRPDAPLCGTWQQLADVIDPHGCGLVYQPWTTASATIMAIGRRGRGTRLGCVQVFDERYFWDNILQAGETVDAPDIVAASLEILDALEYSGFFTLNWLRTERGLRLSSLRPAPRAVFQLLRRGGVDPLCEDDGGIHIARPGLRMIATPTYVSYRRLST